MPRKPKSIVRDTQVNIRLDLEEMDKLRKLVTERSEKVPGMRVTASDVIRCLIHEACDGRA